MQRMRRTLQVCFCGNQPSTRIHHIALLSLYQLPSFKLASAVNSSVLESIIVCLYPKKRASFSALWSENNEEET